MGVLLVLFISQARFVGATILVNGGQVLLAKALLSAEVPPGEYPHRAVNGLDKTLAGAAQYLLNAALAFDGSHAVGLWSLGRTHLALGEYREAAQALSPLESIARTNSFVYQDELVAYYYAGYPDRSIALYEASGSVSEQALATRDTIALAYVQRAAPDDLRRAIALRPGDLYATYRLWQEATATGDMSAAASFSQTLAYFPLTALAPTDERLLDYATEIVPDLLEQGLWDRYKTLNVVSYLVWQRSRIESVEKLLQRLAERNPKQAEWPFYLAELHFRQSDLNRAETWYKQTLMIDPKYAQAYLRLGMVQESQISKSANQQIFAQADDHRLVAAKWYELYHEMVPDDLLGLKKLVAVYEALGRPEAAALRQELEAKTDDQHLVAESLRVPVGSVELAPNLVKGDASELWLDGHPQGWEWSDMATGSPWNKGVFVGGDDELGGWGRRSTRVDGLWLQQQPDKEAGRFGFWHGAISLESNALYLVTFSYRTAHRQGERPGLWLSGQDSNLFAGEHFLSDTGGAWRQFAVIGWSKPDQVSAIQPLLRSWGLGEFDFDAVRVRKIVLKDAAVAHDVATQFILQ
jgi:tetratricopeptide (TPR) repeat protein